MCCGGGSAGIVKGSNGAGGMGVNVAVVVVGIGSGGNGGGGMGGNVAVMVVMVGDGGGGSDDWFPVGFFYDYYFNRQLT